MILLTRVWLGLLRKLSRNPGVPVRRVVLVVVVWALPLLLAPPLFSRDVYSYAGQGEMVSHHIDPYVYGTGVLGSTPFSTMPDSLWTNTPSPYGPTFLSIDGVLDKASGHKILPDVLLLRLLELGGLALIIGATPTLARKLKRDPAEAVLLGAGSPLVLATLIAGAHNEALMLGLLLAGLAVAHRWGTVPGLVFLGWAWAGPGAPVMRRFGHTLAAGLIALVTLEVISTVSGSGWGWLRTATAADKSFTAVTPVNAVAKGLSGMAHAVDLNLSALGARTVFSVIGLVCAAVIGIWLLLESSNGHVQRNLGLTLLIGALLGPILWSWYATWGILVLAPAVSGSLRRFVIAISTIEVFVGISSVKNLVSTVFSAGILPDLILLAALFAIVILPLGQFSRARPPLRSYRPRLRRRMIGLSA
jgi:hypothetical protein